MGGVREGATATDAAVSQSGRNACERPLTGQARSPFCAAALALLYPLRMYADLTRGVTAVRTFAHHMTEEDR